MDLDLRLSPSIRLSPGDDSGQEGHSSTVCQLCIPGRDFETAWRSPSRGRSLGASWGMKPRYGGSITSCRNRTAWVFGRWPAQRGPCLGLGRQSRRRCIFIARRRGRCRAGGGGGGIPTTSSRCRRIGARSSTRTRKERVLRPGLVPRRRRLPLLGGDLLVVRQHHVDAVVDRLQVVLGRSAPHRFGIVACSISNQQVTNRAPLVGYLSMIAMPCRDATFSLNDVRSEDDASVRPVAFSVVAPRRLFPRPDRVRGEGFFSVVPKSSKMYMGKRRRRVSVRAIS
jgi:hypothetical protein